MNKIIIFKTYTVTNQPVLEYLQIEKLLFSGRDTHKLQNPLF